MTATVGEETKDDPPSTPPPENEERLEEGDSFSDEDAAQSVTKPTEHEEPAETGETGVTSEPTEKRWPDDVEQTINLTGDLFPLPGRDDLDEPTQTTLTDELDSSLRAREAGNVARTHLKGLLEALIFASDSPIKASELAKSAAAPAEEVKHLLGQLKEEYATRGMQLSEVAGGWSFRTNASYAPFVRDLTKQKPVKLSRAQIETLAILAYRQPITRPEIDEIRGVDSGATLKMLLERDVVKILGKKDEPGRPLLYGTTAGFLELFQLKSLKDLPTLREFTELNEDSRRVVERELGETLEDAQGGATATIPPEGAPAAAVDPRAYEEDGELVAPDEAEPVAAEETEEPHAAAEPVEDEEPEASDGAAKEKSPDEEEDEDDEPDSDDFDDDEEDEEEEEDDDDDDEE